MSSLGSVTLFVERFVEPVTAWPMLGVGVELRGLDSRGACLEVAYDGVPRLREALKWADGGYRHGVQIPQIGRAHV